MKTIGCNDRTQHHFSLHWQNNNKLKATQGFLKHRITPYLTVYMRFSLFLCRRPRPVSVHITSIVVGDITGALTPTGGSIGVGGSGTNTITHTVANLVRIIVQFTRNKISVMAIIVQNNLYRCHCYSDAKSIILKN